MGVLYNLLEYFDCGAIFFITHVKYFDPVGECRPTRPVVMRCKVEYESERTYSSIDVIVAVKL